MEVRFPLVVPEEKIINLHILPVIGFMLLKVHPLGALIQKLVVAVQRIVLGNPVVLARVVPDIRMEDIVCSLTNEYCRQSPTFTVL